ncbi:2-oxo acid dehydrogenase subunit E2 [Streptomyces sp. NPDC044989]|uniref:2-oxo acid dehydrogenase subunit E2 n=1 Tax=Streptomyces sp. NPDC044989 TaxID=3154336 RepID=UPI003408CA8E
MHDAGAWALPEARDGPRPIFLAVSTSRRRRRTVLTACGLTSASATLSADHRATDGAVGARYLAVVVRLFQTPEHL